MSNETNNLQTMPLNELVYEITYLDQEIDGKVDRYNKLREELLCRWPLPELEETYQPKELIKTDKGPTLSKIRR